MKRWMAGLVFALCFLAPMGAWASSAAPPGGNPLMSPTGFAGVLTALQESGTRVGERALKIGNQLLWLLLVIAIAWFGIQVMLGVEASAFESAVGGFVSKIFIWGLIAWLMRDYAQITNAIVSGFAWLSTYLTGGNTSASQVAQTAGYFLPGIHLIHTAAIEGKSIEELPWFVGSVFSAGFLSNFASSLVAALAIGAIEVLTFIAAILYIGIAMLSMLLVSVAIAIGPIFIPFFMLEFTSFLFNGWFRFLLVAAAYRLVGGVIISIIQQFLLVVAQPGGASSILFQTSTHPPVYVVSLWVAVGDVLVMAVIVFLVLEIPKISSQIVNGAPNVSMREIGGFAKGFSRKK